MDITKLSKELIEQITNGASESDVIQLLTDNAQTLQLLQPDVSSSSLSPSDLIVFAKWISDKGYSHRLKLIPNDLIDYYLRNKEKLIKDYF